MTPTAGPSTAPDTAPRTPPRGPRRRAFTLAEAAVCVAVVGVMMAAALQTVGGAVAQRRRAKDLAHAQMLAQGLLSEVLTRKFEDEADAGLLGTESGESAAQKAAFDDVDDFHDWSESPPQDGAGLAMGEKTGWSRSVAVSWVDPQNAATASATRTGAKLVTVTVSRGGKPVTTAAALRTSAP